MCVCEVHVHTHTRICENFYECVCVCVSECECVECVFMCQWSRKMRNIGGPNLVSMIDLAMNNIKMKGTKVQTLGALCTSTPQKYR